MANKSKLYTALMKSWPWYKPLTPFKVGGNFDEPRSAYIKWSTCRIEIEQRLLFLPHQTSHRFSFYKADYDNNKRLGILRPVMSWYTVSKTIPTTIFTILASYAIWESHSPYKKRQRLRQTVSFFYISFRLPSDYTAITTSFPAISAPGGSLEIVLK